VFFNLFSEAEPFAAILIAHGTHVFWGGLLRPKGPKFEAKGREWERVLGRGSEPPPHELRGLGKCSKLPSRVWHRARLQIHFGPTKSLEHASRSCKGRTQFIFLLSTGGPVEPLEPLGSAEPQLKNTVIMHRTIGLTSYIWPLTVTLVLVH